MGRKPAPPPPINTPPPRQMEQQARYEGSGATGSTGAARRGPSMLGTEASALAAMLASAISPTAPPAPQSFNFGAAQRKPASQPATSLFSGR
jgi:hypothetical protein